MSLQPCHKRILKHLRKHPYNSIELKALTGLMELSCRLHELEVMGFEFDRKQRVELPGKGGAKRKVALYCLISEPSHET